jgi:hypothetical protein
MADVKITALTAISANPVNPATFPMPMVDLLDTSMAASGTTKKVTVNQILGAGGTATLASATITGDLTVRTTKLAVTSTGVGCGTATPANQLSVRNEGASGVSVIDVRGGTGGAGALQISGNGTTLGTTSFDFIQNGAGAFILNRDATPLAFSVNGSERYNIGTTGISTWSVAGTTAMTLNSTGLGVGGIVTGTGPTILVEGTAGTYAKFNSKVGAKTWSAGYRSGTLQYEIQEDATERFVIANGGNVGIGVTPSAKFHSKAGAVTLGGIIETGGASSLLSFADAGTSSYTRVQIGSVGNTLVGLINGVQALTLDASGNLLVGVASSSNRLDIQKSTDCAVLVKSTGANTNIAMDYVSNYGNHTIRKSGTAVWDFGVINDSSATPAFKFSNGPSAVGVQLVHGATAWTALSDETVKDIIEPITNAITKVGSLRSVIGKFKTDDASKRRSFLIAQDVFAVLPEAVDVVGEKNELGVRYSDVIPLLVAAIKELSAEVNALKNA